MRIVEITISLAGIACNDDDGDLGEIIWIPVEDSYFLVVPFTAGTEGSYGSDSSPTERLTGVVKAQEAD